MSLRATTFLPAAVFASLTLLGGSGAPFDALSPDAAAAQQCELPVSLAAGPGWSVQVEFEPRVACLNHGFDFWGEFLDVQGQEVTKLTLTASHAGSVVPGDWQLVDSTTSFTSAGIGSSEHYQGDPVVLDRVDGTGPSPATATGTINPGKIYDQDSSYELFTVGYDVRLEENYLDGEGYPHQVTATSSGTLLLYFYRGIDVKVRPAVGGVSVSVFRPGVGGAAGVPVPGFFVEQWTAGQNVRLSNPRPITDETGQVMFRYSMPLSEFPAGAPLVDEISVDPGGLGFVGHIPVTANFATVTGVAGDVTTNAGGSWAPVTPGGGLQKGHEVRLGNPSPDPPYAHPSVTLLFADGKVGKIEMYTPNTNGISFTLGDSYVEGQTGVILMNGTTPLYDSNAGAWAWGKAILRTSVGLVGMLTPLGWELRAGVAVGLFALDWWALGHGPSPGDRAPSAQAAEPQPETGSTSYTDVTSELMGDGSLVVRSRGAAVKVQTADAGRSAVLPAGSQLTVDGATGVFSAVTAIARDASGGVAIQLSPADGAVVDTPTPVVTAAYPGADGTPVVPQSFSLRVNGVLVSPGLKPGPLSTSYAVPPGLQLVPGTNLVKAAITTESGIRTRAAAQITAPDAAPAAPEGLAGYPGRVDVLLRWRPNLESDLAGYRVYRAAAADGAGTLLNAVLLTETFLADSSPITPGAGWYFVTAVDAAGHESPATPRIAAALDPAAAVAAPPLPAGFAAEAGDAEVALIFEDRPLPAVAWRVLRSQSEGGPFAEVAVVARSGYRDRTVANGVAYWYRLVPLGYDLAEGPFSAVGPATPADTAPAPPAGLTAERDRDQLTLEWNPSRETDLAGYHVYRIAPGGSYSRVNPSLLVAPAWGETLARDSHFLYAVSAVDQTGHESQLGMGAEAAGRRSDMEHLILVQQVPGGFMLLETQNGTHRYGTPATLTALPEPGFSFGGWTGDVSGDANPHTFTITEDLELSGIFDLIPVPGTLPAYPLAGSGVQGFADGTGAAAQFYFPEGLALDSSGNLYVGDVYNYRVRKIAPGGVVTTLAGSGAPGSADGTGGAASFNQPAGVAVDGSGVVYVADRENCRIRKITSGGTVSTLAGSGSPGCTDGTGAGASFFYPSALAVDGAGNVLVADTYCRSIRRITPAGVVSTVKAGYNVVMFNLPRGIALGGDDTQVYVSDTEAHQVKLLDLTTGAVTLIAGSGAAGNADGSGAAASFNFPRGLARDAAGNVYVADQGNHRIRKISASGLVTTLSGSVRGYRVGGTAMFDTPVSVAVDDDYTVFVADFGNHRIRWIAARESVQLEPGAGGTLSAATATYDATFQFQAGSVGEAATVYFTPGGGPGPLPPAPPDAVLRFSLGGETAGGAPLAELLLPFTIVIHYSDADLHGIPEAALVIYLWQGGAWTPLATQVDPDANTLTAQTTHLGEFMVSGPLPVFRYFLPLLKK